MKVLYLSYDGLTEGLGQSQILPYLEGLSRHGNEIHLITFEKANPSEFGSIYKRCTDANIFWYPLKYTKKPPVFSTIYDLLVMNRLAKMLVKTKGIELIHCRSYLPMIIGHALGKKYGAKTLFDMRGFWPEERTEGGLWKLSNPLFKRIFSYFKQKEKLFLQDADAVVSLTEAGKKDLIKRFPDFHLEEKTTVIPCCVRLDLFDPKKISANDKTALKKELGLTNQTIFGYVGSIGTWYMLDEMLAYFKVQWEQNNKSVFLFISKEPEGNIRSKAQNLGLPKESIVVKGVTHGEVAKHISIFDYAVYFIRPSFSKTASSPIKQAEIIAMGIPIITNAGVGDSDKYILESKAGALLKDFSEQTFVATPLPSNPDQKDIRNFVYEHFSLEKGVEKYQALYESLCPKSLS